jgi:hypothetical protein
MDTLKYSGTVVSVCLVGKTEEEANEILRQIYNHKNSIRVCPCIKKKGNPWVRESLRFLDAIFDNEVSH